MYSFIMLGLLYCEDEQNLKLRIWIWWDIFALGALMFINEGTVQCDIFHFFKKSAIWHM